MHISEDMVKEVILEVLQEMQGQQQSSFGQGGEAPALRIRELGPAKPGTDRNEVVIGVPPAFGTAMTKTIINIPHGEVLREVMAGVEEEGLKPRLVRVNKTADVGFIAHEAAKLSGSGIGVGIISRGTSVIHQKDLAPLQNLELFP
ncbi:MAG: propanediol dehydratase, partial [Deltaproteobacteria bacterium]